MGYGSLVGPGAQQEGIDQGVDFVPTGGGGFDIYAPASGTITLADATGHHFNRTSGQALIILQLDTPPGVPDSSQFIYFAEIINIAPGIVVGAHVTAGAVIGHCDQSPGIEVGWGRDAQNGFKCEIGGPTPCGSSFDNWVQGLPPSAGGSVSGGGGGAEQVGAKIPDFNDGPTAIPVQGDNASTNINDPVSNLPVYWAQNVSPYTGGVIDWAGLSKPQQGVLNQNYGQLLHGSMKTAGTVGVNTPNFIVYFMWNPASIDFKYTFDTSILPQAYQNDVVKNEVNMLSNQTFNFTLIFDRVYEVGYFNANGAPPNLNFNTPGWSNDPNKPGPWTMGVQWDVRAVERLMGIYDSNTPGLPGGDPTKPNAAGNSIVGGNMPMANAVDIAFGSVNAPVVRGFWNGCSVRYTRFSENMIPTRCEVDCTFIRLYLPVGPGTAAISSGGLNPYVATPTVY